MRGGVDRFRTPIVRTHITGSGAWVAPSVVWGVAIGLVIAVVDAVAVYLTGALNLPSEWPIDDIDLLLNVMLYTLVGFRVGRASGLVRDAAEGGVIAGVVVTIVIIGFLLVLKPPVGSIESVRDGVAVAAQNVALGGILAIISGWFGARAGQNSQAPRR
jgi:hypothetical protein